MKVLSLFANIGVAEALLKEAGYNVVIANEKIPRRAKVYSEIYPQTTMVCGDICDAKVFESIISLGREQQIDIVMATPPCQGVSRAGKQKQGDERNLLILPVISAIKELNPKYALIENVPQFIDTTILFKGENKNITALIKSELGSEYKVSVNVIDTKYYGVPQTRQRAIILLSRKDQREWILPERSETVVTLEDTIGDLPSLDPYVIDISEEERNTLFPCFEEKLNVALSVSQWHIPPKHIFRQVIVMMHTPTGKTAFDNKKYKPIKKDGTLVSGYKSTYRRLRWSDPASTVTMDNRKISSQNNVHPGRYIGLDENGDEIYSDARALSLFELMKIMSLPSDWPLPSDLDESFIRSVIGEGIPPLFIKKLFMNLVG